MSTRVTKTQGPVKVGVPLTDLTCALYGALAAARGPPRPGADRPGQFIDVCLFEVGRLAGGLGSGADYLRHRRGACAGSILRTRTSPAPLPKPRCALSDGFFTLGATSARNWEACCDVVGLPS